MLFFFFFNEAGKYWKYGLFFIKKLIISQVSIVFMEL